MTTAKMWTTDSISDLEFRFNTEAEYLSKLASMPHKTNFKEGDKIFIHIHVEPNLYHEEYPYNDDTIFRFTEAIDGTAYSGINDISGYARDGCPYWNLAGLDCNFYLKEIHHGWNFFNYYGRGQGEIAYLKYDLQIKRD